MDTDATVLEEWRPVVDHCVALHGTLPGFPLLPDAASSSSSAQIVWKSNRHLNTYLWERIETFTDAALAPSERRRSFTDFRHVVEAVQRAHALRETSARGVDDAKETRRRSDPTTGSNDGDEASPCGSLEPVPEEQRSNHDHIQLDQQQLQATVTDAAASASVTSTVAASPPLAAIQEIISVKQEQQPLNSHGEKKLTTIEHPRLERLHKPLQITHPSFQRNRTVLDHNKVAQEDKQAGRPSCSPPWVRHQPMPHTHRSPVVGRTYPAAETVQSDEYGRAAPSHWRSESQDAPRG